MYNFYKLRIAEQNRNDEILFNNATLKMENTLEQLERMVKDRNNDASSWDVYIQQLSAFHNIARTLTNFHFRQLYCVELNTFTLKLYNLMKKIEDSRFFYGIKNYQDFSNQELYIESERTQCKISLNVIGCILQFLQIFHGVRGDYLSDSKEIDKILKPVHYGWAEDINKQQDVQSMASPYKQMLSYATEWYSYKKSSST